MELPGAARFETESPFGRRSSSLQLTSRSRSGRRRIDIEGLPGTGRTRSGGDGSVAEPNDQTADAEKVRSTASGPGSLARRDFNKTLGAGRAANDRPWQWLTPPGPRCWSSCTRRGPPRPGAGGSPMRSASRTAPLSLGGRLSLASIHFVSFLLFRSLNVRRRIRNRCRTRKRRGREDSRAAGANRQKRDPARTTASGREEPGLLPNRAVAGSPFAIFAFAVGLRHSSRRLPREGAPCGTGNRSATPDRRFPARRSPGTSRRCSSGGTPCTS